MDPTGKGYLGNDGRIPAALAPRVWAAEAMIRRLQLHGGGDSCCKVYEDLPTPPLPGILEVIVNTVGYNDADTSVNPDVINSDEGNNGFSYPGSVDAPQMWLSEDLLRHAPICAIATTILHEAAHIAGTQPGLLGELQAKATQEQCKMLGPNCNYDPSGPQPDFPDLEP
jgi:hypothetical protein